MHKYADMVKNGLAKLQNSIMHSRNWLPRRERRRPTTRGTTTGDSRTIQHAQFTKKTSGATCLPPDKDGCTPHEEQNNKIYHWYPNHNDGKGMWTLHLPDKCHNKKGKDGGQNKKGATGTIELKPKVYLKTTNPMFDKGSNEE